MIWNPIILSILSVNTLYILVVHFLQLMLFFQRLVIGVVDTDLVAVVLAQKVN